MTRRPPIALTTACVTLLGVVVVCLVGCSSRPDEYVLASGEFVFEDGTPVSGVTGLVRFSSIAERSTKASSAGELQADGTFELATYESQYGEPFEGLPAGEYNVVLLEYDQLDTPRVIPDKYRHFEESPWKATVVAGEKNHFKLVVEKKQEQAPE